MAERKSVLVRLRPEIYEALRSWAADDFRSVNGQIEFLLHESLRKAGREPRRTDADAAGEDDATKRDPGAEGS